MKSDLCVKAPILFHVKSVKGHILLMLQIKLHIGLTCPFMSSRNILNI